MTTPHQLRCIGWAVKQLQDNQIVRRRGWNGKNMHLHLVTASKDGMNPYVAMKTADGSIIPWHCSQTDLLAIDWEIAS